MTHVYRAPFHPGGATPIDAKLAEELLGLALSKGGEYADLYFEYAVGGSFVWDEGFLKTLGRSVSLGLGVRVVRGEATGYAYVEALDEASLKRAALTAAQIAQSGQSTSPIGLKGLATPQRYALDAHVIDVAGAEKRALLERADKAARAYNSNIIRVEASLSEEYREVLIATSDGVMVSDVQPLMRMGVRAIAERDGKRQSGSSGGGGRMDLGYFDEYTPEWHGKHAAEQAIRMLDAREAPAGDLPVILAPGDSGILLHEAVGHGLEADFNRKRTSNYTDQVGKNVASDLCTVVDDATFTHSRGSINVDDEGQVPTKVTLIENGVLTQYMHDKQSARHFKTTPNGHGRRESFRSHPMPRMTNTLLLAGKDNPEDIIRSVERGVYAKRFGGGQVDISNGDFVFSLTESYLIENGKLTAPLKDVNLIGNGPEVMRRVSMLGSDFALSDGMWTCGKQGQSVPVGVGCPTIKISSMTVGGTQLG